MINFIENRQHRKSARRPRQTMGVMLVLLFLLVGEFLPVVGNAQTIYAQSTTPTTASTLGRK